MPSVGVVPESPGGENFCRFLDFCVYRWASTIVLLWAMNRSPDRHFGEIAMASAASKTSYPQMSPVYAD
jgi:hypothetical protein